MTRVSLISLSLILVTLPAAPAVADRTFALVIGVNRAPRAGVSPLKYADDDAVLFHALMSTMGRSVLLASPDADTRRMHKGLAEARRPTRKNLKASIDLLLGQVARSRAAGERPVFYFIYSGHGDVKNNQGFLVLDDGVFTSRDLETLVLKRSRAVANHVIIDACKSYYMIFPKRAGGERRRVDRPFYRARSLAKMFPDTGFLLSTSSGRSSHEWEAFQAGVFSHEVRSGLPAPPA